MTSCLRYIQSTKRTSHTGGLTVFVITYLCLKRAASCQQKFNAAGRAMRQSESHELLASGQVLVAFRLAQLTTNSPTSRISWKISKEGKRKKMEFAERKSYASKGEGGVQRGVLTRSCGSKAKQQSLTPHCAQAWDPKLEETDLTRSLSTQFRATPDKCFDRTLYISGLINEWKLFIEFDVQLKRWIWNAKY